MVGNATGLRAQAGALPPPPSALQPLPAQPPAIPSELTTSAPVEFAPEPAPTPAASSAPAVTSGQPATAPSVLIDAFQFRYGQEHPKLPAIASLGSVSVRLQQRDGIWASAPNGNVTPLTLGSIPDGSRFDATALRRIAEEIVQHYNDLGIYGVWVALDGIEGVGSANASDASSTRLVDNRNLGDRVARVVVWVSQIVELRTLARGARIRTADASNNRKHRWIAEKSPLQPPKNPGEPGSLLFRDALENYLRNLSLQPSRRVEASVASAGEPGQIVLDYLVTETKPWQVFAQISNTGTKSTDEWRGRVGFQDHQLTNHDDTFNLDLISSPDFVTRASFLSYRIPVRRGSRFSARVYGSYGDFAADGLVFDSLRFVGDNWMAGSELIFQGTLGKSWDLTLNAGANYAHYKIDTNIGKFALSKGQSPFLIPFVGAVVGRDREWWSVSAGARVEYSVSSIANDDPSTGVNSLGRIGATADWTSLRLSGDYRMYLEPLFRGKTQGGSLANEISLRFRSRFLLSGSRLIPQEQELLGGSATIRGYPESVIAADQSVVVNAEYALHFPRLLKSGEASKVWGRPFRWRPSAQTRRTDWDLIGRAFVDYAYRGVNPAPASAGVVVQTGKSPSYADRNFNLYSVGGGAELVLWQNFSIRCDVGMAMVDIKDDDQTLAKSGDIRSHVSASFYW